MHTTRPFIACAARAALPLLFVGVLSSVASAQHAKFVMFGDPNPEGLELPAERRAVHPLTSPFYHEDSFITTDVRAWWLRQDLSEPVTGGGYASGLALQVRVALTDRLQFVAYKDGYLDFNAPVNGSQDGLIDLGAGLKWAFLQNWETDTHAAVGVGYEVGIGDEEVLQGDDEVRLWTSFDKGFDRFHIGATANYLAAVGSEDALGDSDRISLHGRADYWVNKYFSPVLELNYYDTVAEGNIRPLPITGVDIANLGGGKDNDVLTAGYGFELRPAAAFAVRVAHESPLTSNDSIFGHRWTVSATWSF